MCVYNTLSPQLLSKFGNVTIIKQLYHNNVSLSLPPWLYGSLPLSISLSLSPLSIPRSLQAFRFRAGRYTMLCVLRTLLVLVSWGIAVGIPRFELCLALVGSLATTILAFILPPLFHLALKWRITATWKNVFHVCLLVAGIGASAAATTINLYAAITQRGGGSSCSSIRSQCEAADTSTGHCQAS